MMNLYLLSRAAEFTSVRQHPLEQLAPVGHDELRMAINKDSLMLSLERNPPKVSHQRFLVLTTLHDHLQALSWPMFRLNGGFVLPCHLCDGRAVFACQCFEQRCLRYPVQRVEPANIVSQEVVLDYPSVLRLILAENAVITLPYHVGPLGWLAPSHIECTFLFNDFLRHS